MIEGINMLNEIQPWPCELACCPIDPFVNCCTEVVLHSCGVCYQHNSLWSPKECLRLGIKCCRWHYWVSGTSPPSPAMPDDKYSSVENCAGHLVLWLLRPVKLHRINSRINTVTIILCNKMCTRVCVCVCVIYFRYLTQSVASVDFCNAHSWPNI